MLSQSSMKVEVPGKLMVAGEFAVLQPNQHLIVMAVDRYVYATIDHSKKNYLHLLDFQLETTWEYKDNRIVVASDDSRTKFVEEAMTVAVNYLRERGYEVPPFQLSIKSELDDESGVKYGLGSSAAVVTSVITAILNRFLPSTPSPKLIYQLASISHVLTQGNGSGADVAASSYGGFLNYSSFQADWLQAAYQESRSLTELLERDWTYASLEPVTLPNSIYLCIGWTGKPASTKKLVDELMQLKTKNPDKFSTFLSQSEQAVNKVLQGMKENKTEILLEGIKENRQALASVGRHANVDIETSLLTKLCDLAEAYGGAGKPSGAGGGDCGIALMPSKEAADKLITAWKDVGIKPLSLKPYPYGAKAIKA
ncbi:phosphomevalonate kinase [Virgibacillus proomii]|uniref:phosphomevalonate kinase n=1 Tax=Virgibacillus proomii TaxID=84407 RepID=UPI0020A1CF0A|nr:phosphomevalonate kinase [Virgibacillus proomii]